MLVGSSCEWPLVGRRSYRYRSQTYRFRLIEFRQKCLIFLNDLCRYNTSRTTRHHSLHHDTCPLSQLVLNLFCTLLHTTYCEILHTRSNVFSRSLSNNRAPRTASFNWMKHTKQWWNSLQGMFVAIHIYWSWTIQEGYEECVHKPDGLLLYIFFVMILNSTDLPLWPPLIWDILFMISFEKTFPRAKYV